MKTVDLARECGAKDFPAAGDGAVAFLQATQLDAFAARIRADAPPALAPKFDAMTPRQEELTIQFCEEIAGRRGQPGRTPDPVRLLEMAEALYFAEVQPQGEQQPQPSIRAGSGAVDGDLSASLETGEREAFEAWFAEKVGRSLDRNMPDKSYNCPNAFAAWRAWQARAALAASQPKVCDSVQVGGEPQTRKMISSLGRAGLAHKAFGNPIPIEAYALIDFVEAAYGINTAAPQGVEPSADAPSDAVTKFALALVLRHRQGPLATRSMLDADVYQLLYALENALIDCGHMRSEG